MAGNGINDEDIMDERVNGLEHLFTLEREIDGWPSDIKVFITHYEKSEYVVFVKLITQGMEDRDYVMRWLPNGLEASWEFVAPMEGAPELPDDLWVMEEEISDKVVAVDL